MDKKFNHQRIRKALLEILGSDCLVEQAPMRDQIAFRVGGPAAFLAMPETVDQLVVLLKVLQQEGVPYFLMGNGSNLLVRDEGYAGVVVKTRSMDMIDVRGATLQVEAGAMLRRVADVACRHGLSGMAFASGIPGTVGGAVMMNAGAYGGEMRQIVASVEALMPDGTIAHFDQAACDFDYRHSVFQENGAVVLSAALALTPGDCAEIADQMKDLNARRREKQPLEYPSAGSTFRRPEGSFAGKLIEDCGLKGYTIGGAQVSEKHAGFVINHQQATAEDVMQVIAHVQETVKARFGVDLKREVIIVGEDLL